MLTLLAWLFGAVGLAAGVFLSVLAIGQVVFSPGAMLVWTVLGAAGAFALAWACSRHIEAARVAERRRLAVAPLPQAVDGNEAVLRMRWVKWCLATAVFGGLSAGAALFSRAAWRSGEFDGLLMALFAVCVVVPLTALLLQSGWLALRLGGVARLDAHGFRHALLAPVPWKAVLGIDLEVRENRDIRQWFLVLVLDPALAASLRLPWWWRVLGPACPSVEGRKLTVPLTYVRGRPEQVVGQVMGVADAWGAPRIPGWRSGQDLDLAAQRHAAATASQEEARTVQRLVQQMRTQSVAGQLTPEASKRLMAAAQRSLDEIDARLDDQLNRGSTGRRT